MHTANNKKWQIAQKPYHFNASCSIDVLSFEQTAQPSRADTIMTKQSDYQIDELDAAILNELQNDARVGVLELSRRLDVALSLIHI